MPSPRLHLAVQSRTPADWNNQIPSKFGHQAQFTSLCGYQSSMAAKANRPSTTPDPEAVNCRQCQRIMASPGNWRNRQYCGGQVLRAAEPEGDDQDQED